MHLKHCIAQREGEFLLFALTPPRLQASPQRRQQIADVTLDRLAGLKLDGLILYDIDDESDRNPQDRPFPFLPAMDPADYFGRHLSEWSLPVIVYRAVGKYTEGALSTWLKTLDSDRTLSVFVGASSGNKDVATSLGRAQELRSQIRPDLMMGGVAIPERHVRRGDEHLRLMTKHANGCSFFVTQVVYDVNAAKNLVSDYHDACVERAVRPAPIVFTFSVCGSRKTLEFLQWLGVGVPRWIESELQRAGDILETSYHHAVANAIELANYCRRLGVPFGLNVESVSIRAAEIAATVHLAERLRGELVR
jgi:hypothetical protein